MAIYTGLLKRVGSKEGDMYVNANSRSAVGTVRVAGKVSVVEIGDTLLRDVGCPNDLYDLLEPGREASLFVHHHFFNKPVLLGVRYSDDGEKYLMRVGTLIANVLSYILLWPLLILVGGFLIGLMGGREGGFMAIIAVLFIVGGLGYSLFTAVMMVRNYLAAVAAQ